MTKPKVTTNPVANNYAGPDERIVEYSTRSGLGGLIAFRDTGDKLTVDLYRHDPNVEVRVSAADTAKCTYCHTTLHRADAVSKWEDKAGGPYCPAEGQQWHSAEPAENPTRVTDIFVRLFEAIAACEAPKGTQVDDVLTEFQPLYDHASATDHATCRHCGHAILLTPRRGWICPEAGYDDEDGDGIWRETCPDNHEDRIAAHEPGGV